MYKRLFICISLAMAFTPGLCRSEDVTITTYYPSPSGIFKTLSSTGTTSLATGTGSTDRVGIGTASASNKLTVSGNADFTGNVGIGTSTPSQQLTVSGNANIMGNLGAGTSTIINKLDVEGASAIGATYSGNNTAPTNGLVVEGNTGIGTPTIRTSTGIMSPKLDVDGDISATVSRSKTGAYPQVSYHYAHAYSTSVYPRYKTYVDDKANSNTWPSNANGAWNIGWNKAGAGYRDIFTVVPGGVGIYGTNSTTPTHLLEVESGSTYSSIQIKNSYTNGKAWDLISSGNFATNPAGSFAIADATANATRVLVDTSGNVGIGTTSPTKTLDVNGTFKFNASNVWESAFLQSAGEGGIVSLNLGVHSFCALGYVSTYQGEARVRVWVGVDATTSIWTLYVQAGNNSGGSPFLNGAKAICFG